MNYEPPKTTSDIGAGLSVSILLALLLCTVMSEFLVELAAGLFHLTALDIWKGNIAAGLFLGIVIADPVGTYVRKSPPLHAVIRFGVGLIAGIFVQIAIVTPMAGGGMSRFVFLIFALFLVPLMFATHRVREYMDHNNIILKEEFSRPALWVMDLPVRLLIVGTMLISFTAFWKLGQSIQDTLHAMAIILVITTIYVTRISLEGPEVDPWEEHEAEPIGSSDSQVAKGKFLQLLATFLPGAVLLGGVMRLAVEVVIDLYPNIGQNLNGPVEMLQSLGLIAISGLAVVLFGMLGALGFGFVSLLIIGRFANWNTDYIKECCVRLIKVMCFRPLKA